MRFFATIIGVAISAFTILGAGHDQEPASNVFQPYIKTHDQKHAAFSVELCVNYDGKEIRKSTMYFSPNTEPEFKLLTEFASGDGSGGKWRNQSLNISTRDDGIHVRFSDSAGQTGTTQRKIQKLLRLPWTQTSYREDDGLYSMTLTVNWKSK